MRALKAIAALTIALPAITIYGLIEAIGEALDEASPDLDITR